MKNQVLEVFSRVFRNCDDLQSLQYGDKYWDSLKHIELITDLETEFNIVFEVSELYALTNVNEAQELIRKKVVDR